MPLEDAVKVLKAGFDQLLQDYQRLAVTTRIAERGIDATHDEVSPLSK